MAREPKDTRTVEQPLSAMLAEALATAPIGPMHGALVALESALIDLKQRAASVNEHLDADCAPILERIKAL
jgi:hypothetical protein